MNRKMNIKSFTDDAEQEVLEAVAAHGQLHSMHEGFALLLEEVQELGEVMTQCNSLLDTVWSSVRTDDIAKFSESMGQICNATEMAYMELVQVRAMALKGLMFVKDSKEVPNGTSN